MRLELIGTTVKDLALAVRQMILANPDAFYVRPVADVCSYSKGYVADATEPMAAGCLVGQVLPLNIREVFEGDVHELVTEYWLEQGLDFDGSDFTDHEYLNWLTHVQLRQDAGDTWAKALERADDQVDTSIFA